MGCATESLRWSAAAGQHIRSERRDFLTAGSDGLADPLPPPPLCGRDSVGDAVTRGSRRVRGATEPPHRRARTRVCPTTILSLSRSLFLSQTAMRVREENGSAKDIREENRKEEEEENKKYASTLRIPTCP